MKFYAGVATPANAWADHHAPLICISLPSTLIVFDCDILELFSCLDNIRAGIERVKIVATMTCKLSTTGKTHFGRTVIGNPMAAQRISAKFHGSKISTQASVHPFKCYESPNQSRRMRNCRFPLYGQVNGQVLSAMKITNVNSSPKKPRAPLLGVLASCGVQCDSGAREQALTKMSKRATHYVAKATINPHRLHRGLRLRHVALHRPKICIFKGP